MYILYTRKNYKKFYIRNQLPNSNFMSNYKKFKIIQFLWKIIFYKKWEISNFSNIV